MGKPTTCIGENKGADQLCNNRKADQCLFSLHSTIPLLSKSKISSFQPSVTVQASLCRTWLEPKLLVFTHRLIFLSQNSPQEDIQAWISGYFHSRCYPVFFICISAATRENRSSGFPTQTGLYKFRKELEA